jgi:hypothetical protein
VDEETSADGAETAVRRVSGRQEAGVDVALRARQPALRLATTTDPFPRVLATTAELLSTESAEGHHRVRLDQRREREDDSPPMWKTSSPARMPA